MAQVAISSGSIVRPYRSPWGAFPTKHMTPISTNAAIQIGRVVTLDYTANSTNVGQIKASSAVNHFHAVGIAGAAVAAGSSGVANSPIPVYEANPNVEFVGNLEGGVSASSLIGTRKALRFDSTLNIQVVDLANSSAGDARIVITGMNGVNGVTGLQGELGDSGAQVTFRFITNLAGVNGSTVVSSSPLLAFYS